MLSSSLEPTQLSHELGVDPELVDEVDGVTRDVHRGIDADQRERHVKRNDGERFEGGLAERDRKVQVFTLVMNRVHRPEHVHHVAGAVPPVVNEVDPDEPDDPGKGAPSGNVTRRCS